MQNLGTGSDSLWSSSGITPDTPAAQQLHADVCVIGAGIAGLTCAVQLARHGKAVIVLDMGPVGGGETGRTTAHLANALDDRYTEIERNFGAEGAKLAAESHTAAIAFIEQLTRSEQIHCDFTRLDGFLFAPPDESVEILEQELEAAHRAGVPGVEVVAQAPIPGFDTGPCLRFPHQGQFHPLKYLAGLAQLIQKRGGHIFTPQHVTTVEGGSPAKVETKEGLIITAEAVIVATNVPFNDRVVMHTKLFPYRTYALAARIPRGQVPLGLYWDTLDPYHYVRLQRSENGGSEDYLIVGGEDHKTGQGHGTEQERYTRLEQWARERFHRMGDITHRWSGEVIETPDGLAYLGKNPWDEENVYIVTGDSGMGMTHGTIAGLLIPDLILGRSNPWAELYSPSRKPLRSLGEYAKENLNVAAQYADWVTGGDVKEVGQIAAGSGAVVRRGLKKIAVYRDEAGTLHERSAVCPHLGCIVDWNQAEKSWDCPCHGSRFDCKGELLHGPSPIGLPEVEQEEAVSEKVAQG